MQNRWKAADKLKEIHLAKNIWKNTAEELREILIVDQLRNAYLVDCELDKLKGRQQLIIWCKYKADNLQEEKKQPIKFENYRTQSGGAWWQLMAVYNCGACASSRVSAGASFS